MWVSPNSLLLLVARQIYVYKVLSYMYKVRNERLPDIFNAIFIKFRDVSSRNIRQNCLYHVPNYRTKYLENTIIIQGPKIANDYKSIKPCLKIIVALELLKEM